jgi:hypothetical protein
VGGHFHAGQRVRVRVDVQGFRAGDTGRVPRADRAPAASGEDAVYFCEIDAPGGPRLAALYPEEIEPLS